MVISIVQPHVPFYSSLGKSIFKKLPLQNSLLGINSIDTLTLESMKNLRNPIYPAYLL